MGQAKRRREHLGDDYGKPEASKRYANTLRQIARAKAEGVPVVMAATTKAADLVEAACLPWLHELPEGAEQPLAVAWDLDQDLAPAIRPESMLVMGPGWDSVVGPKGLPRGAREQNLQQLGQLIAPAHLQEVRDLLQGGYVSWERRFPPAPAYAGQFEAVLVGCSPFGLLKVGARLVSAPSSD